MAGTWDDESADPRAGSDVEARYTWWCVNPVNHGLKIGASSAVTRAAFQDSIDEAAAGSGGAIGNLVEIPPGVWTVDAQLKNKNKVRLVGCGKRGSIIKADASFPINTPVVRLGDGTGIVFDSRVENIGIDCSGIAGSTGVWTTEANEGSGAEHVLVTGYTKYGIDFDNGASIVSGDDLETYGDGSGSLAGVRFNNVAGANTLSKHTAVGAGADGLLIVSSHVVVSQFHAEGYTDGIDCGANSTGHIIGAHGHSTTTNLVHLEGSTKDWTVASAYANGSANILVDDFNGITIVDNFVRFYAQYAMQLGATRFGSSSSAPTTGAHVRGEIVFNSLPSSAGFVGFVCTASGTPGTWKTFGLIS